ncbi:MAG: sulfurtransferase TusA family protein [Magnetococcales bacterium]|nr:sulfurtransferase TusA family protein [Magnetococcales bacterium]
MSLPFTEEQIERYSRQILLPRIGGSGQQRLLQTAMVLIGSGTMAATAAWYLAGAGVGRLFWLDEGGPVGSQIAEIPALNPDVELIRLASRADMTMDQIASCRLALLCDSDQTVAGLPLLAAWSNDLGGYLIADRSAQLDSVDAPCWRCATACYRTITSSDDDSTIPTTALSAGWLATLLASTAIATLLDIAPLPTQGIAALAATSVYQPFAISPQPGCPWCGPITDQIDISADICPMTAVRVKLKLESMSVDGRLRILLRGQEPLENIPLLLRQTGYRCSEPRHDLNHTGLFMLESCRDRANTP